MTARRAVLSSIIFGVSALACSGGGNALTGPTYADARAVADGLGKAGIVCMNYRTPTATSAHEDTAGRCTADNEAIRIATFKDAGAEKNWIGELQAIGCAAGKSLGVSVYGIVEGNRWTIETETETEAKKIADQFGGVAYVYHCG